MFTLKAETEPPSLPPTVPPWQSGTPAPSLIFTAEAAKVAASQKLSWHPPGLPVVEQKSPFAMSFPPVSRLQAWVVGSAGEFVRMTHRV